MSETRQPETDTPQRHDQNVKYTKYSMGIKAHLNCGKGLEVALLIPSPL